MSETQQLEIRITGRLCRLGRVRNEWYDFVQDPVAFSRALCAQRIKCDVFSFLPEIHRRNEAYPYQFDLESIAVIPLTSYENWWTRQISDKTRNMARKARKKGIHLRVSELDEKFVRGIMAINDESPMRQGRPYWHYRKDFDTVLREHATFQTQSQFIGAYLDDLLVGYIKLVHGHQKSSIMQILSMISHRDKAPNNALIAKAVELCAERNVPYLHYATWSRRGLGEFKVNHGFQRFDIPRYYIPVTLRGTLLLRARFHRRFSTYFPESVVDSLAAIRARWYAMKFGLAER